MSGRRHAANEHDSFDPVGFRFVQHEARIDWGWVRDHAQAQAGRTSAIGHRLLHIHGNDLADWAVGSEHMFAPSPDAGAFLAFGRND